MKRFKVLGLLAGLLGVAALAIGAGTQYPYFHARWFGMGSKNNTEQFSINTPSAGASAVLTPGVTNTNALGSSSLRFSNVFTTLLNASGAITAGSSLTAAGTVVGNGGFTVFNSTAPRTATDVASIYTTYSPSTGTWFYNSTDKGMCYSTGTTQVTIAAATAPATACGH